MKTFEAIALIITFLVLSIFVDGAFFWAAFLTGFVTLASYLISESEDD